MLRLFLILSAMAAGATMRGPAALGDTMLVRPDPAVRGSIGAAVQSVLAAARGRDVDGEIILGPGVYAGEQIAVRLPPKLMSLKLTGSGADSVIDGLDNQGVFFRLNGVQGRATRLQISDLTIRRYRTAIILYGSREHPPSWNGFNTVERVAFEDIGARGATTGSTGALILINSRSNRIRENRFSNVYNVSGCGAFHAIYMAHFSSANEVGANHFDQRCGDPIRIRDASNDNVFRDNTFAQPAPAALYTEWFCDKAFQPRCTKRTPECPPAGNAFEHAGQSFRSTAAASPVYADLGQKYFPRSCRCQPGCRWEP